MGSYPPMRALIAVVALALTLIDARSAYRLQGLGSTDFLVDTDFTTAAFSQNTNNLVFLASGADAPTLAGLFAGGAKNWSMFSSFGLRMSLVGAYKDLGFTVDFFDEGFNPISAYTGSTLGLGPAPSVIPLTLSIIGTGDLSSVFAMQFTWDKEVSIDTSVFDIVGNAAGSFTARAPAGFRFITSEAPSVTTANTNPVLGAYLPPGTTSWSALSDSNAKTGVTAIDHRETLRKVSALPVTAWQYRHDPSRRYVGPMAQDFRAAFGLGFDDKHISTLDADGVALSALKGLIAELEDRKARSAAQAKRLGELQEELRILQQQLGDLPPSGE